MEGVQFWYIPLSKTLLYITLKPNFDFPQIHNNGTCYGIYRVQKNSMPKLCEVQMFGYQSRYATEIDVCA